MYKCYLSLKNVFEKYFDLERTVHLENESYYQWNENEERNQRNPLFCKYWQAISRLTMPQKKHATCSQKSRSWFLWDMRNLNISSTLWIEKVKHILIKSKSQWCFGNKRPSAKGFPRIRGHQKRSVGRPKLVFLRVALGIFCKT